ncbi:MAG: RDD family protein [Campylobacterales bacterium]
MADATLEKLYREGYKLASVGQRAFAFVVDELLVTLIVMAAYWDYLSHAQGIEEMIAAVNSTLFFVMALKVAYHTLFIALYGATLGKMATRIVVVDQEMLSRPDWVAALRRASMRLVSEMLFWLGFFWALVDPLRQSWHDKFGQTLVISLSNVREF